MIRREEQHLLHAVIVQIRRNISTILHWLGQSCQFRFLARTGHFIHRHQVAGRVADHIPRNQKFCFAVAVHITEIHAVYIRAFALNIGNYLPILPALLQHGHIDFAKGVIGLIKSQCLLLTVIVKVIENIRSGIITCRGDLYRIAAFTIGVHSTLDAGVRPGRRHRRNKIIYGRRQMKSAATGKQQGNAQHRN